MSDQQLETTAEAVVSSQARDERLRSRARETIRYELEGAAKDGLTPSDDWTELVHGRDVLSLIRERDALRIALSRATTSGRPQAAATEESDD